MKAICVILIFVFVLSCNKDTPIVELGIDDYKPMPANAQVLLFDDIADSINALIPHLDSSVFSKGRTAPQAYDTDLAKSLVTDAEKTGGINAAGTVFKNKFFDDHIVISLNTEYHKPSLKLLKEWEQKSPTGYTEAMYTYSAKIRIKYTVDVDGKSATKYYHQQSQFSSGIKLDGEDD